MAFAALGLGTLQLVLPKGTPLHRLLGRIWVLLMAGVAVSAVFIHELRIWGQYSPIHLLVPVVLYSLWQGIRAARQGDIRRHRLFMRALFLQALVLTGLFTLLPGRAMHAVLFGA